MKPTMVRPEYYEFTWINGRKHFGSSGSHTGQLFSSGSLGTCHLLLCIGSFTLMSCCGVFLS